MDDVDTARANAPAPDAQLFHDAAAVQTACAQLGQLLTALAAEPFAEAARRELGAFLGTPIPRASQAWRRLQAGLPAGTHHTSGAPATAGEAPPARRAAS